MSELHPHCKCTIDVPVNQRWAIKAIPRKPYPGKLYEWRQITDVFSQEQSMHREDTATFEIRETNVYGRCLHINVEGLDSLPSALRRLAEMGYDLTNAHKALTEAVEEQRKRNALTDAVKAMTKPAESQR